MLYENSMQSEFYYNSEQAIYGILYTRLDANLSLSF